MFLSIIVPFHNAECVIGRCAASLVHQSYPREGYELIFVDSGSDDGASRMLRNSYPSITVLHVAARNAYVARNEGLRVAKGELVAFTDADCVVSKEWVEQIISTFLAEGGDLAMGKVSPPAASPLLSLIHDYESEVIDAMIASGPGSVAFGYTNNMAVRADFFRRFGMFDEVRKRGGDTEFVMRCISSCPEIQIRYTGKMEVTHLEMTSCHTWLRKKFLYGKSHGAIQFKKASRLPHLRQANMKLPLFLMLAVGRVVYEGGRLAGFVETLTRSQNR